MIGDKEIPIDGSSQMIILGSNLPHTMSYGNQTNGHVVEAVVVHVNPSVWGAFYELPESPDEGRSVYVVVFDAVGL